MTMILMSLIDKRFKSGLCRGEVVKCTTDEETGQPKRERICYVYGKTQEDMWRRKRAIARAMGAPDWIESDNIPLDPENV